MINVELISYTQNPIETCTTCAAVCYDSEPKFGIIKHCIESGHTSVLEHCSFTFKLTGVSRALLAQITRHRIASYSVRSQRYCTEDFAIGDEPNFVVPNSVKADHYDIYKNAMKHSFSDYNELLRLGLNPEDARMVLPNACKTTIMVTMNLRALGNFMQERLCGRAQWEIRKCARLMKEEVLKVLTEEQAEYFKTHWLVPKCETHSVPFCEEKNSCGYHKTLTDIFNEYKNSFNKIEEKIDDIINKLPGTQLTEEEVSLLKRQQLYDMLITQDNLSRGLIN